MQYGEKISALRKQKGMTQAELGAKLNVTFQAVSKWERGESLPDFETMSRIAKLFGVPITYFEEDSEDEQSEQECERQSDSLSAQNMIGICRECGKVVSDGEEAEREPHIICKDCSKRIADEKEKAAKSAAELRRKKAESMQALQKYKKEENVKCANRGLICSAIITGVVIALILVFVVLDGVRGDYSGMGYTLLGAFITFVFLYPFIAQLFWDGLVRDMVLFGGKIVGMPGVIFSLDLDGIIFLVGVKILFALIKMLIFIITLLFGVLITVIVAPFSFVPQLIKCRRGTL